MWQSTSRKRQRQSPQPSYNSLDNHLARLPAFWTKKSRSRRAVADRHPALTRIFITTSEAFLPELDSFTILTDDDRAFHGDGSSFSLRVLWRSRWIGVRNGGWRCTGRIEIGRLFWFGCLARYRRYRFAFRSLSFRSGRRILFHLRQQILHL